MDNMRDNDIAFIVGSPRSGTTWLQRMLAALPSFETGQESGLFDSYLGPQLRAWRRDLDPVNSGRSAIGLGCYLTEDEFVCALRAYMNVLLGPMLDCLDGDQIFVEKTPSHALFINEIEMLLPGCKFVHVLRDPRDVVASLLAASRSWGAAWAPKTAAGAAEMWRQHVQAVHNAKQHLPHDRLLEIRYEDLQASPLRVLGEVTRHLGRRQTPESLERAVRTNGKKNEGTPIPLQGEARARVGDTLSEPRGFVRRGLVGSWRHDLSFRQKFEVWRRAMPLMQHCGYPWSYPWSQ